MKTSTVLHLFEESGLDPQDVLELIACPEDLIAHLYTEQSNKALTASEGNADIVNTPQCYKCLFSYYTCVVLNVHKIAREAAAILQVNIKMVKKNLLNVSIVAQKVKYCMLLSVIHFNSLKYHIPCCNAVSILFPYPPYCSPILHLVSLSSILFPCPPSCSPILYLVPLSSILFPYPPSCSPVLHLVPLSSIFFSCSFNKLI